MSDFNTKKCDNCGKIKLESNGWWVIGKSDSHGLVLTVIEPPIAPIDYSNIKTTTSGEVLDLCGHTCVVEKVSKLIGARKHHAGAS